MLKTACRPVTPRIMDMFPPSVTKKWSFFRQCVLKNDQNTRKQVHISKESSDFSSMYQNKKRPTRHIETTYTRTTENFKKRLKNNNIKFQEIFQVQGARGDLTGATFWL